MAWYTTHSITAPNAKGTNTVIQLQQDLISSPGTPKKLPIIEEPVVEFGFGNEYGEGLLTYWTRLKLINNYESDDLLNTLVTNSQEDFRLLIIVGDDELFRGKLDLQLDEKQITNSSTDLFIYTLHFHNGFAYASDQDITAILNAINSSGNTLHTYQTSDDLGSLPYADLWGQFIYQGVCGYESDDILIAHDWKASAARSGVVVQLTELQINPYFMNAAIKRADFYKHLCRAFAICTGYSWKQGKPILQDLRKGSGGDYTARPCTRVTTGVRTVGTAVTLNEQDALKWINKTVKAPFHKQTVAVNINDRNGTLQALAANDFEIRIGAQLAIREVKFDPTVDAETGGGGQRYGISVGGASLYVPATTFTGWDNSSTATSGSLFTANAHAQMAYSRALPYEDTINLQGELDNLVDPMLPVKIGTTRYRIAKGELYTIRMITKVRDSVPITDDDSNFTLQ